MTSLLETVDIGQLTKGLRDNAEDIYDLWMNKSERRREFGHQEMNDLVEVALALSVLLKEMEEHETRERAPILKVVN